MTDPADEAEALAALLASPCPSWCDSDEGHNWVDDGREGYVRSHARVIGAFTVFAAEYLRPDGTIQTDTPAIESHLPDDFEADEARMYAADLVEAARVLEGL